MGVSMVDTPFLLERPVGALKRLCGPFVQEVRDDRGNSIWRDLAEPCGFGRDVVGMGHSLSHV